MLESFCSIPNARYFTDFSITIYFMKAMPWRALLATNSAMKHREKETERENEQAYTRQMYRNTKKNHPTFIQIELLLFSFSFDITV